MDQALLPPVLLQMCKYKDKQKSQSLQKIERLAVFYSGSFCPDPELLNYCADVLCSKQGTGKIDRILCLGYRVQESKKQAWHPSISFGLPKSYQEFLSILQEADMVFCYPGMILLEAWFLHKKPILFATPSEVHNQLSLYLKGQAGFIYLDKETILSKVDFFRQYSCFDNDSAYKGPTGNGYDILLGKITNLM